MAKKENKVNWMIGRIKLEMVEVPAWLKLLVWVGGVEVVGLVGGVATASSVESWYQGLAKPWFSPPNWLFGPVWTVLYAMIGVVGYRLWSDNQKKTGKLKQLYAIQLGLNAVWSPVFFGLKSPIYGAVVILCLWGVLFRLLYDSWEVERAVFGLLLPYSVWVSFAAALNLAVVWLN